MEWPIAPLFVIENIECGYGVSQSDQKEHFGIKIFGFSVVVVICSGLTSLSTIVQSYHDSACCDRELNAHFYSAASLKYHAPAT